MFFTQDKRRNERQKPSLVQTYSLRTYFFLFWNKEYLVLVSSCVTSYFRFYLLVFVRREFCFVFEKTVCNKEGNTTKYKSFTYIYTQEDTQRDICIQEVKSLQRGTQLPNPFLGLRCNQFDYPTTSRTCNSSKDLRNNLLCKRYDRRYTSMVV